MTTAIKEQTLWRIYVQKVSPDGSCSGVPAGGFWAREPEHRRIRISFKVPPEQVRSILGLLAEESSGYPIIEVAQSAITGFEAAPPGLHGWAGTGARF